MSRSTNSMRKLRIWVIRLWLILSLFIIINLHRKVHILRRSMIEHRLREIDGLQEDPQEDPDADRLLRQIYFTKEGREAMRRPRRSKAEIRVEDVVDDKLDIYVQNDTRVLNYIRQYHLIPPSRNDTVYQLSMFNPYINAKWKDPLSKFILELTGNKTGGFFVECGASDGVQLSNTLALEMKYQWSGILIEADPILFRAMVGRNRKAWMANACLSLDPHPHMLNMFRHRTRNGKRHSYSIDRMSEGHVRFKTICLPLYSILSALNVTTVDYLSLDIEGDDLSALRSFPFNEAIVIKIISIDMRVAYEFAVRDFLVSKGYRMVKRFRGHYINDFVFVHESESHASLPLLQF